MPPRSEKGVAGALQGAAEVTRATPGFAWSRESIRARLGRLGGLLVLVAYFWGLAVATTSSSLAWLDLAMLLVVYGLLSAALWAVALAGASIGRIGGLLGSLPLAAFSLWHLREQTFYAADHRVFLVAVLLLAMIGSLLARRSSGSLGPARAAAAAGGLALLFLLVTSGLYLSSNTFRWHLLRHNMLVGTPAYYLLSVPVQAIEEAALKAHVNPRLVPESPGPIRPGGAVGRHPDPPNIVFVMIDTLRADQLEAYGGPRELMPNLNRLAERSFVFEDVLANASWTRPSVASFLTGLPAELHGAVDRQDALPPERFTLAEALHAVGFGTAAFVSNYGAVGRDAGFAQGFDDFEEVKDAHTSYARAEVVNSSVADWLARRESAGDAAPVFLYIHYLDPHTPYLSGCDGECPTFPDGAGFHSYQKQLRYLDAQLRWVIEDLPAALGRRTVLLVTSDHGEEFGEHGRGGHGHSLYRELLYVPAILQMGVPSGSRIDGKLEASDFFELIERIATDPGLEINAWALQRTRRVRYSSLDATSRHAFHRPYQGRVFMRALERDGLFFISSAYGDTREIYDTNKDPFQRVNLARARDGEVESLSGAMDDLIPQWVERVPLIASDETLKAVRALGYLE